MKCIARLFRALWLPLPYPFIRLAGALSSAEAPVNKCFPRAFIFPFPNLSAPRLFFSPRCDRICRRPLRRREWPGWKETTWGKVSCLRTRSTPGVLTIYTEKPEIPFGKSNGSHHSDWKAPEIMGCRLGWCIFSILFSLFNWFGYTL